MEILSTGEKIRRARIYKGFTLKEICEDKLSVSRMSCIENNKVKPDKSILQYIAQKLQLDIDYLEQDVKEQLIVNIEYLKKNASNSTYEKDLDYNLNYALEYNCIEEAIELMHLLFNYYIGIKKFENLQLAISNYYNLCQRSSREDLLLMYYMDLANYYYAAKEYVQAINYFHNLKEEYTKTKKDKLLAEVIYRQLCCYMHLNDYDKALVLSKELIKFIDYFKDDRKAEVSHAIAITLLIHENSSFEYYEKQSYDLYMDKDDKKGEAALNFSFFLFKVNKKELAVEYIFKGVNIYPKTNRGNYAKFILNCIELMVKNGYVYDERIKMLSDESLNFAIDINSTELIERAYYFKSKILQCENNLIMAETYMNLSLDALMKFGSKERIQQRYNELGYMYYKMDQIKESIKYFNLAITLENKI